MDLWLLIPMGSLSLCTLVGVRATRDLHPATAVRVISVLTATSALACGAWVLLVAVDIVVEAGPHSARHSAIGQVVVAHHPLPVGLGILVVAWTAIPGRRLARTHRATKATRGAVPGEGGVIVADDLGFVALAVPGRRARIAISRQAVDSCSPAEMSVVVAHEWAHLRCHHSWYATAARASAIACPWLGAAERRVAFLLERWADEEAAAAVHDRALVGRTIARLALDGPDPPGALAFAQGDAVARARAMFSDPPRPPRLADRITVAGTSVAATGLATSGLQLHHAIASF